MRAFRLAGEECWEAAVVDAGQDIILSDGMREERVQKSMARRFVTSTGTIMYLVNLDFGAVTTAQELATLEERICFDALNGSTQPASERTWGAYASLATMVVVVVMALWVWGASNAASQAAASSAALSAQLQHVSEVVAQIQKAQGVK